MTDYKKNLLDVRDLSKFFLLKGGFFSNTHSRVKAVDQVSFHIRQGETLGLVGESGCGKTTLGRTILRLYEPDEGQIFFDGEEVTSKNIKKFRKRMQMIFQDPYASLNPRMTVADIIGEALEIHKHQNKKERMERIYSMLETVGLHKEHSNRYPHEFSGGQRQRIGIARTLAVEPEFIVCDEPISALDVSIQAQIVNMLEDLQKQYGLTYLFIAHDLSMVRHISDRVGVMYLGKMIELSGSDTLYQKPAHPYTQALLSSIPIADPDESNKKQRIILEGDVPSPINPPSGCRFRTRCRFVLPKCSEIEPEFKEIAPGHLCACHLY
ncbi:MAG: dipeptide ABC transporter ATP-binding protein [Clostridia bacterium]|nr:dipeptide ABC transporter ATP-binding protein [Clostridia bacterium]